MYVFPGVNLAGAGKAGVFLFFVLSSFLLTLPLINRKSAIFSAAAMSNYWQRRFFRIYPLYTLYLLLAFISTFVVSVFFGVDDFGVPFALNGVEFFRHIFLLEGKGVTWSIAVEFKFYFLLPFLAALTIFFLKLGFLWSTCFLCLLLIISQIISPESEAMVNDHRLLPYMPIFIIGIFLATLQMAITRGVNPRILTVFKYLGMVAAVLLVVMIPSVYSAFVKDIDNTYFHNKFLLFSLLWSFVLISAVNVDGFIKNFFSSRILRYYGALSFSIYLFHPIFIDTCKFLGLNGYLSFWVVLIGSTASAFVSFKLLEGPVSNFKLRPHISKLKLRGG